MELCSLVPKKGRQQLEREVMASNMGLIGGLAETCRLNINSSIVKRSIVVTGHKTSISLEHDFWKALK